MPAARRRAPPRRRSSARSACRVRRRRGAGRPSTRARSALGARHGWLPLGLGDGDGLVAQGVGEQRHPGGRDDRVGRRAGRAGDGVVSSRSSRARSGGEGVPGGSGVGQEDGRRRRRRASSAQRSRPWGSPSVPVSDTTTGRARPSAWAVARAAERRPRARRPGRGGRRGRARGRAAARRTSGRRPRRRCRSSRSVGSIIGWARPRVSPSSPKSMTTWPASRRSAPSASSGCERDVGRGCRRARPPRPVIASSARVPPQNSPRRAAPRASPLRLRGRHGRDGHCGTGWPSAARKASTEAVRSGRPAPSTAQCTGSPSPAAYASTSASTAASGGFETTTTDLGRRVVGERAQRLPGRAAPDGRLEVAPPDAEAVATPTPAASSRHITCWAPVPDAATMPTDPGRTTLAKPRATPPTMRRAAVGAHDEHVGGGRGILERAPRPRRARCRRTPSPTAPTRSRRRPRSRRAAPGRR